MRFSKITFYTLPLIGGLVPSVLGYHDEAQFVIQKREEQGELVEIILDLKYDIAAPMAEIKKHAEDNTLYAEDLQNYLGEILFFVDIANKDVEYIPESIGNAGGDGVDDRLNEVGDALGEIITEIFDTVGRLKYELKADPGVGELTRSLDEELDDLVGGVEESLPGVLEIVNGLLGGEKGFLSDAGKETEAKGGSLEFNEESSYNYGW